MRFNNTSILLILAIVLVSGCIKQNIQPLTENECNTDEDCSTYCSGVISCKQGYAGALKCSEGICICCEEFYFDINDPFGAPPKEVSPNCGPEERYKFNVTINSKEDFVEFIKNNKINQWVGLDDFKEEPNEEVNWDKVLGSVMINKIGSRIIYSVDYTLNGCLPTQKFTLKMTTDGHVSVYGCCGK